MRYGNNFGYNFRGSMIIQLQEAMIIGLLGAPSSCLCHRLKDADIAISTWCCTTVFVPLVVHMLSSTCCASAGRCWIDDPTAQIFHLVTSVVFNPVKEAVKGRCLKLVEGVKGVMFAVVPAAVQGVLCRGDDFLCGVSIGCLPQCPQGLVVMACASSSRTILKWISFEQSPTTLFCP